MTTAESKWQTASSNASSAWTAAETAASAAWTASEGEARVEWKIASDAVVDAWNIDAKNAVDDYNADVDDANDVWKSTNDNAYTIYSSAYDSALASWNSKEATASAAFTSAITSSNATAIGAEATAWNAYVNASNGQMLGARLMAFRADPAKPQPGGAKSDKEEKTPESEQTTGNFRKGFNELLKNQMTILPGEWEAHHKYIEELKEKWIKDGVDWNNAKHGLGVPGTLNREFYQLYKAWLKKYHKGDATKIKAADLDKLNKAIDEHYKKFLILPTDTRVDVKKKVEDWFKEVHPKGEYDDVDEDNWKDKQKARFIEIWKLIDGKAK